MIKCVGDFGACQGEAEVRGLCRRCYSVARVRVSSKLTTWEELESFGLAIPSTRVAKSASSFDQQLAARRAAAVEGTLDVNAAEDAAEDLAGGLAAHGVAEDHALADPAGVDLQVVMDPRSGFPVQPGYSQCLTNPDWERNDDTGEMREKTAAYKPSLRDRSLAAVAAESVELPTPERAEEIEAGEKMLAAEKALAASDLQKSKESVDRFNGNVVPVVEKLVAMSSPAAPVDLNPMHKEIEAAQKIQNAAAAKEARIIGARYMGTPVSAAEVDQAQEKAALPQMVAQQTPEEIKEEIAFEEARQTWAESQPLGEEQRGPILQAASENGIGSEEVAKIVQEQLERTQTSPGNISAILTRPDEQEQTAERQIDKSARIIAQAVQAPPATTPDPPLVPVNIHPAPEAEIED